MDNLWLDQQIAELRRQEQLSEAREYHRTHPDGKQAVKRRGLTIFIQALTGTISSMKIEPRLETREMTIIDAR